MLLQNKVLGRQVFIILINLILMQISYVYKDSVRYLSFNIYFILKTFCGLNSCFQFYNGN